jgi:CubicO group peptidase (beta-lactamase class C family)
MFSQTKFVASIAALQLVDRGLLDLDEDVGKHLPELAAVAKRGVFQGIDEDGKERYLPAERAITLRMLLSHTSGECMLDLN